MTVALTVLFWMLAASRVWMTWRSGWRPMTDSAYGARRLPAGGRNSRN